MTIEEAKQKLIDLAQSQVGYREGPNNYNKYADDPMITRLYGWNVQNQPWCCTFVNWCFLNAFGYDIGSRLTYGGTAACSNSAQLFMNNGAYVHMPEVGDQAFYYSGGGINHTGIVVKVDGSVFTAVEGNYSDKVSLVQHNIGHSDVAGFGRPCWNIVEGSGSVPDDPGQPVTPPQPQSRTILRKGMSGEDVRVLQEKLIQAGYDVGPDGADGEYGNNTFRAVVAFQEDHHLEADSIAGPQTQKALDEALAGGDEKPEPEDPPKDDSAGEPDESSFALPDIQIGCKCDIVIMLQAALNLKGYDCGKPDGDFGPKTQAAVNRFKKDEGLEPDGMVNKETWVLVLYFYE